MAATVQPVPKSTSSSKTGVLQTLVSFILVVTSLVVEPVMTRALGVSKPPKRSRLSSFLPSSGRSNLNWHQRVFTPSGWKLNLRISSEQWKSRLAFLWAFSSRVWASLGVFRYIATIAIGILVAYSFYLLWETVASVTKAPKLASGTSSSKRSLLSWKKPSPQTKSASGTRFDVDAAYSSPDQASSSIIQDIRGAGLKLVRGDIKTLLEVAFSAGKPVDDKKMAMEKVVAIAASLPPNSKARTILTNFLTEGLWKSLQHPPLSYQGEKFEYRMADGSYNNVLFPDLGKAGTPYARTTRRLRKLDGVRPDPGLLFDTLMGRTPGTFKENPAGLSSVLFYHASIIIHDIFRTNRLDPNISDTSSYLDLAPLYGSSLEDQLKIRTMERGLLKPDTFHERRLLGQPPGVNIMLVMYNRFHNYVADMLLKINEGGRFTLPPTRNETEKKNALAKQDNDLFQTARLIVGGLYINISLHDYLRGLTNTHHTTSSWTIDPRVEIKKANGEEIARGVGNQVSAEFNLLYRFHSIISQRDEKWLNDFLKSLFPGTKKKLEDLTPQELLQGLLRWEQNIHPDPSKRVFDGLKRGSDGRFSDEDLVRIMTESMEAPAGLFGPRMVPKALRVVETLGILQARKWRMASLNEFRTFFGLKRHETMEDINPDPEIANLLRHLYDSPDMVELYPGLFIEETKPEMSPGNGGCLGYTAGRAVFSDAITLVRSDRFYTIDYTPATLTNWGMQEVQQDYNVMGGSMFYKLFQRALPGWYPYNSLHVMQPMYTWKKNKEIAEELGTISQFTLAKPKPPPKPVIVTRHSTICKIMKDQTAFRVPWLPALNDLFPGKRDFSSFMLSGDAASNAAQRTLLGGIIFGPADFTKLLLDTVKNVASTELKKQTFELPRAASQINILKDIAIPVNAIIQADLFSLDLNGPENPSGTLSISELYKHLTNVRTWGFNNNDPAMAFRRRLWAQESTEVLTETTTNIVSHIAPGANGLVKRLSKLLKRSPTECIKEGSLRWYGQHVVKELLAHGKTIEETAEIMWLTAIAGVGAPVGLFADVLQFFLQPQNATHWAKIQDIVSHAGPTCHQILRQYVLEAQRMTSRQRNLRICAQDICIDGQEFKKGDAIVCLLGPACHDSSCIPDPQLFKPGRPVEAYIHFGHGPHECLGKEITLTYCVGLLEVVAGLKNLRPAPGAMGELKSIQIGTERCYLDDTWSWLTFDPTTWKLHFDGVGKGVCQHSNLTAVSTAHDVNSIYHALKIQDREGPTSVDIAGSRQQSLMVHSSEYIDEDVQSPASASAQDQQTQAVVSILKPLPLDSQAFGQDSSKSQATSIGESVQTVPTDHNVGQGSAVSTAAITVGPAKSPQVPSALSSARPIAAGSEEISGKQQGQSLVDHPASSSSSPVAHIRGAESSLESIPGMTTTTITHPIGTVVGIINQAVSTSQDHGTGATRRSQSLLQPSSAAGHTTSDTDGVAEKHVIDKQETSSVSSKSSQDTGHTSATSSHGNEANEETTHNNGTVSTTSTKKETSSLIRIGTFSTKEVYTYPQHKSESSQTQSFTHPFTTYPNSFISIRGLDFDRSNSHSVSTHSSHETMKDLKINVEATKDTKLYRCDVDWMLAKENSIALGWWDTGANRSSPITTVTISFKFDKPVEEIKGMLVALNGFDAEGTSGGATSLDISARATSWDSIGCTIEVTSGPGCKLHRAKGHWLAYTDCKAIVTGVFTSAGNKHLEEEVKFSEDSQKFDAPPKIIAGLNKITFDISKANLRCLLEAKDVTKEGFKWVWDVWADSVAGECKGVYAALDQKIVDTAMRNENSLGLF